MVEKIHSKKAALEAGAGEDNTLDVHSPFTPANSFVESNFGANYAKETQLPSFHSSDMVERILRRDENLPSLNSAEIANRIKQRQAELTAASADELGAASPDNSSPPANKGANSLGSPLQPYTPQNSYRDSPLVTFGFDSHYTDMNDGRGATFPDRL
nr:hypothetical protein BaRGS_012190 [Batillaria attramentaria]